MVVTDTDRRKALVAGLAEIILNASCSTPKLGHLFLNNRYMGKYAERDLVAELYSSMEVLERNKRSLYCILLSVMETRGWNEWLNVRATEVSAEEQNRIENIGEDLIQGLFNDDGFVTEDFLQVLVSDRGANWGTYVDMEGTVHTYSVCKADDKNALFVAMAEGHCYTLVKLPTQFVCQLGSGKEDYWLTSDSLSHTQYITRVTLVDSKAVREIRKKCPIITSDL